MRLFKEINPNAKKLEKKDKAEFNPIELIKNEEKRKDFIVTLGKIKERVSNLRKEEVGEWESFFKSCGFNSLSEVSRLLSSFINILEKKQITKAIGQLGNIKKITGNIDRIDNFLGERGIDLGLAA